MGKYAYEGKLLRSEYMTGANLSVEYVDFGSGLLVEDHAKLWRVGRWGDISFEVTGFQHHRAKTGLPEISELYQMLKSRANPSTLATVELPGLGRVLFQAAAAHLRDVLKAETDRDGGTVEVYAAQDLDPQERQALERRLGRDSNDSTVYVILSKAATGAVP